MGLLAILLTVLFVGLKLAGVIAWSWWLVLLPAYAGVVLLLAAIILGVTVAVVADR